jgi:pyrroloquinoline quinone biosynthesis protein D
MLRTDKVTGDRMLLYPEGALALNPTGAAIVDLCDGRRTFAELIASLAAQFNAPADVLAPDVSQYLARLRERGLVDILASEQP